MTLTTGFECGSGTVRQISENHWEIDTVGDAFGYNKYFCFEAANGEHEQCRDVRIDIFPDPTLGSSSHFLGHFPSHIWYSARNWHRWIPLRHTWEDSVNFLPDRISLRIPLRSGATLQVATNPPLRYSEFLGWVKGLEGSNCENLKVSRLGRSFENREIPLISVGDGPVKLVVLAGQHASEHSGVWAAKCIVDFLVSAASEAANLRRAFSFSIVPMLNPDGNVRGRSGAGAQQFEVNNSMDFAGVLRGEAPLYAENRLLWQWLEKERPELFLHFHGYLGWRCFGDLPGDGFYFNTSFPELDDHSPHALYSRAILDRVLFETPGHSAHFGEMGETLPGMVDYQLARAFGTATLLYEVNSGTVGVAEQYRRGLQVLRAVTGAVLESPGRASRR